MIESLTLIRGNRFFEEPENLKIQGLKELQVVPLLRAQEVQIFDRGNSKVTVTFNVTHQHLTTNEAINYIMKHTADISSVHGTATFELEDLQGTAFHLTNASVRQLTSSFQGITSFHAYELVGSKIETIHPPNIP